ncbi:Fc.00g011090.m01.CDS01 [Cosmosporella sp. VM-42]
MGHQKLNVGVVGIGRMRQRHALNILYKVPRANLLCACSLAESDLCWAAEHLTPGGVNVFATFEEMIETLDLEAVVVSSATSLHLEHTTAALDKGIHVLCEKPICTSAVDLSQLIQRIEANPQTKLMVGFMRRFDESNQDAYKKLKEGVIGRPVVARAHSCAKLDLSTFGQKYLEISGGIFLDSTIHNIDLVLFFLGEDLKPQSVSAVGVSAIHTELEVSGDVDTAIGVCEFWGGKFAFFYNSRIAAHGYDNATEIMGTGGKLSINMTP